MDQDRSWSRGRSGWNSEGLGLREGADGRSQSPRRIVYHSGLQPHHKLTNRPVWDDTVQDLASMRLTPAELARKLASRQSSNMVLARAQLLEQSRRPGSHNPNLPPALAARLQAARQQSVDSILAQSNAMLLASQKIRQSDQQEQESNSSQRQRDPDGQEDTTASETARPGSASGRTTPQSEGALKASEVERERDRTMKTSSPLQVQENSDVKEKPVPKTSKDTTDKSIAQTTPKHQSVPPKPARRLSADGAATRTSLDHTITMVLNTCRELWQQLQEERVTRERLQQQLHQQGNVISTLTSELLQIQEQQEAILQEVNDARASGLWGGDFDLLGGNFPDRGDDLLTSHTLGDCVSRGRPSPQSFSGRHPQRSILRATRTIHQSHSRQPPTYQSQHQSRTYTSSVPYQPPHSPRPHQPTPGSRDSSPPPLGGVTVVRSEGNSYRNSIARQIRDALASGQSSTYAADITKMSSQLNKEIESSQEINSLDKERLGVETLSVSSADKENVRSHVDETVMDSNVSKIMENE